MKNFVALRLKDGETSEKFYKLVKESGQTASTVIRCAIIDFIDGKFEKRKEVMESVKKMKKDGYRGWIYV